MVVFEASQPLSYILREIRDNVDYQKSAIDILNREYAVWNSARTVTPDMKRREEALRDVIKMLNMYEETVENIDMVDKSIGNLHEVLDDIAGTPFA